MPNISRTLLIGGLLVALLLTPHAQVGARGCGEIESLAAPDGDEPVERWRYTDPNAGSYQITGQDRGVVYVGASSPWCAIDFSSFAALDDETGEAIWEIGSDDLDGNVSGNIEQFDDRIIFPLFGDDTSGLTALDAATGDEVWRLDGQGSTPDPIGLVDQLLITVESDLDLSTVAAVDLESGEPAWSVDLDGYAGDLFITDDALITSVRTGDFDAFRWETIALDPEDGDELWTLPEGDVEISVEAEDGGMAYAIAGEPFLAAEAVIAFEPATGDELWRTELDPEDLWIFAGIVDDGILLRGGLAETLSLMLIDLETGDEVWSAEELDHPAGTPNAFVPHTDDLAVVEWRDDAEGVVTLTAIDLADGEEAWVSDPIPTGLGYAVSVWDETNAAYVTVNYGESSAILALDLDDGALVWDIAYPDLGNPFIQLATDETIYLSGDTVDETILIALATG